MDDDSLYVVLKVHKIIKYSSLAQSVEHSAVNRSVVGSSPTGGAHKTRKLKVYGFYTLCAEHDINLAGESPVTGIYRQV